jgi:O-antigen/teichoic acid export membrane protein
MTGVNKYMGSLWMSVKKQISLVAKKGAFHVFIGSFITKFVAFFGSVFIVRTLTKTDYGTLGYVENLVDYAYLLAGMGLTNALLRYVILAQSDEEKRAYYNYIIKNSTIFNVILVIGACVFSYFYPHPKEFAQAQWLLPILLLSIPFNSLTDSNICLYRAKFDNKRYAIASFATVAVAIGGKYLFARLWKLNGAVAAPVFTYGITFVVLSVIIYKRYFANTPKGTVITRQQKKTVIKYSLQYMVTNGIWALFMLNDIFLLGQLTGNNIMVADYKIAYVLPGNLSLISSSIGVLVSPYFVKHENDHSWIRSAYKKTYLATGAFVALAVLVLYIFAGPIITLLYGDAYSTVVPVMRVLLIAAFINNGIRYTNANLLSAMGQVKYNMIISLVGVLLQIGTNLLLVPKYGMMGVAYTSVVVYSLMAISLIIVFNRKYFSKKKPTVIYL